MEILSLGQKIKLKRKELNMTLKDLAKDRITPGQISLVESGRSNPSMDLLEYLASNLGTTVEYLMESEESQAEKICICYEQIAETYILNGNFDNAEVYLEKALFYVNNYNLETRRAKILYLKANVFRAKNKIEEAQNLLLSASVIFLKEEKFQETIKTFLLLGEICLDLQSYYSASNYLKQAEVIYKEKSLNNYYLLGNIYYKLAEINYIIEKIDESKKYAYLAKVEFEHVNNKAECAMSLLKDSIEYASNDDINNAIIYSNRSLELLRESNKQKELSNVENDLGKLFYNLDDSNEASNHLEIAKRLRIAENNRDKIVDTKINICKNLMKVKNTEKCEVLIEELLENIDKTDAERIIEVNLLKYRLYIIDDNLHQAEKVLINSYNLAIEMNKLKLAADISLKISKFYMDHKREESAKQFLDEGVRIFKNLGIIQG